MLDKQLFLVIAILALIIVILSKFVLLLNEGFEDVTPNPNNGLCPQKVWWETEAPKQVVAFDTGVKFPLIALEKEKGINSHFQIPFMVSGETDPSGCISVVTEQGTYTSDMCNKNDISQRWRLVQISNVDDYQKVLKAGKEVYSGISSYNINQDTQYGFFMVISVKDPSKSLAHVGSNLSVQTVGPFSSQKWDITKEDPVASISTYDTVKYSSLDNHFLNPKSFNPIQGGNPTNPYISAGQTAMNQKPVSININVAGEALKSAFGITGSSDGQSGENTVLLSEKKMESFNPNCPNCPTILTDYIKNNTVPCHGCNLDNLLTN
uniref:Uncharacterized protein n=1 Tax=viral metagenome TaxID=1070528 RepID=A0A6C0E7A9_9ZZZZ